MGVCGAVVAGACEPRPPQAGSAPTRRSGCDGRDSICAANGLSVECVERHGNLFEFDDRTGTNTFGWVDFMDVFPECTLDSECDDGMFCNGAELCDRDQVCLLGKDPCPGDICVEDGDFCFVSVCPDAICDISEDVCSCPEDCGTPTTIETDCTDGIDNDCDRLVDCSDDDCIGNPTCPSCLPKGVACTADLDCCSETCRLDKNECR